MEISRPVFAEFPICRDQFYKDEYVSLDPEIEQRTQEATRGSREHFKPLPPDHWVLNPSL